MTQDDPQSDPKCPQNGARMTHIRLTIDPQMIPKMATMAKSDPQMTQNDPEMTNKRPENDPQLTHKMTL